MVRKFGKLYKVLSKKGKNLGTATSKIGAEKRLSEVEYFKNKKRKKYLLDGKMTYSTDPDDDESQS